MLRAEWTIATRQLKWCLGFSCLELRLGQFVLQFVVARSWARALRCTQLQVEPWREALPVWWAGLVGSQAIASRARPDWAAALLLSPCPRSSLAAARLSVLPGCPAILVVGQLPLPCQGCH